LLWVKARWLPIFPAFPLSLTFPIGQACSTFYVGLITHPSPESVTVVRLGFPYLFPSACLSPSYKLLQRTFGLSQINPEKRPRASDTVVVIYDCPYHCQYQRPQGAGVAGHMVYHSERFSTSTNSPVALFITRLPW
jgi:hypothetical protein